MTMNAIFYVIGALLYLTAAYGIHKSFQEGLQGKTYWIRPVIACALVIQAWLICDAMFLQGTPYFGMALALSITFFFCTLLLLCESLLTNISVMLLIVLPLAAISMVLPIVLPGSPLKPETASMVFRTHLLFAIFAYSMMTMALIEALLLVGLHNQVQNKKIGDQSDCKSGSIARMPSMMEMEGTLFRDIWVGVIALTVAIALGFVYSYDLFGQAFRFDHKTIVTCLAWCIFVALLLGHYVLGWRGKVAARWTVVGFVFLMIAYIGIRFVLEVLQ